MSHTPASSRCPSTSVRRAQLGALLTFAAALPWLAAGCAAGGEPTPSAWPIVGGTPGGDPAVVWIYNSAEGGLCSGTLIEPRVVLTAKHCVQPPGASGPSDPGAFIVGIGDTAGSGGRTLRVQSVYTTPGTWTEGGATGLSGALVGVDVATLVLRSGVTDIEPIPVRRTPPGDLVGDTFTATGFGEIPSGGAGRKFTTTGTVLSVEGTLIYVGPVTCQGDSGGPMVTADRDIAGVVSFGTGGCGSGYGAYNAIYQFLDSVIDPAIEEGGGCVNDGAEVCDGRDNDCNGMVDEVCTPLGGACAADDECVGNTCRDTVAGRVCTAPCDARRPDLGCEEGLYCAASTGCEGFCVPLTGDRSLPNDADCSDNAECASLFCHDPGDGRRRCLTACRGDDGACLAGEVCAAVAGACGGCVPEALVSGTRGLGESCGGDAQCYSGRCFHDGARSYCSRACDSDAACGAGWHCRDAVCVSGPRGDVGDVCDANGDCAANTFCAMLPDRRWCTAFCGSASDCPTGMACVPAGGAMVCAPELGLVGDACAADGDCITGLCASVVAGAERVCTRRCGLGAPCATGFECARSADGADAFCAAPSPPPASGGCAVVGPRADAGGAPRGVWFALGALGALVVARRAARRAVARRS